MSDSCECNFGQRKILMVVTSASELKDNYPTGVWFEEFAVPYTALVHNRFEVTVASPKGGEAPVDEASKSFFNDIKWNKSKQALADTQTLDTINFTQYEGLIIPGGHGPLVDLYNNEALGVIINDFVKRGKLIAAICHGPAGLLSAKEDGIPFVNGRKLTCFTNEEEIYAGKESVIPFFLEDALRDAGAVFTQGVIGEVNVIEDGNLITAQNYQSAEAFTKAVLKFLHV